MALEGPRSWPWRLFGRSRVHGPPIPGEALRVERVIAMARLVLTALAFVAIDIDPVQRESSALVARIVIALFAAHSVAAAAVLRTRQRTTPVFGWSVHAIDMIGAVVATLPLLDSTRVVFPFFLFVQAAAAFRWGLWETLATTAATVGAVALEGRVPLSLPFLGVVTGSDVAFDQILIRALYLVLTGLLLGYLAEEGHQVRAETSATLALLGEVRADAGLARTVQALALEVQRLFKATHLMLVVEDRGSQRLYRWDTAGGLSASPDTAAPSMIRPAVDRNQYFFGPDDVTLFITHRRFPRSARPATVITATEASGRTLDVVTWQLPDAFVAAHPFRRLAVAPIPFGDDWSGRLFVFDPAIHLGSTATTQFLQAILRQAVPAVFNVYLQELLRARAGAIERARVARELHDGVIQSLISVEMQLQVLRHQASDTPDRFSEDLTRLQGVVHEEVLNLRELMQQLRPVELEPAELLDYLANLVDRFGRDSGINARFVTDLQRMTLPRSVCFELVRIVQEGLVNIRKHSVARNVLVRMGRRDGWWSLEIDDDGSGFPFEGRMSHEDLDLGRRGPLIIKERVRAIGGRMSIDSTPGKGARLEILIPQESGG